MAKLKKPTPADRLQPYRDRRFFEGWDGFVDAERVTAAEAAAALVDDLAALGPSPTAAAARRAVVRCVRRFNRLDDGWIDTTEREDIGDRVHDLVTACGLAWDEDWLEEVEW